MSIKIIARCSRLVSHLKNYSSRMSTSIFFLHSRVRDDGMYIFLISPIQSINRKDMPYMWFLFTKLKKNGHRFCPDMCYWVLPGPCQARLWAKCLTSLCDYCRGYWAYLFWLFTQTYLFWHPLLLRKPPYKIPFPIAPAHHVEARCKLNF